MKKIHFLALIVLSQAGLLKAQNEVDALRYSQITFGGTSRYVAMGGAFGALGADFSTLSANPGGLGLYRSSEITFSPSLFHRTTNSTYNGNKQSDDKYNFNFGNWGLVFSFGKGQASKWKDFNLAIGYNRLNNFHNRMIVQGINPDNSLLDIYLNQAQGKEPGALDDFGSGLAFQTYLLDTVPGYTDFYYSQIPYGGALQRKSIETSGAMGETVLSFGTNYDNKLFFGATVGFTKIRYEEESKYEEIDAQDTISNIKQYALDQSLNTEGNGYNLKLGIIYRPLEWMRLGAAIHTPTFFSMTDDYKNSMSALYDNGFNPSGESPYGSFDYDLTTPFRAIGSLGFIIKENGLVSFDYEFVDYSTARLRATPNVFFDANNAIKSNYRATQNIRLGAEWRVIPTVSLRGGYALYGSPFKKGINDGSRSHYSFGIGFREEPFFIDLTYALSISEEKYYLYTAEPINPVSNKIQSSSFMLTLGFRY